MENYRLLVLSLVLTVCHHFPASAFDVIAHRGASGYLPEHTLEATTLAFAQRPDYIEQDVVITKDGVSVVLHDIHLETVTNVEEIFPQRARDDGRWYALDFTLDELRTLQVHERTNENGTPVFASRYQGNNAQFRIATLDEHIELIQQLNREFGRQTGFYTEIKSPAWHRAQGVDISAIVLAQLQKRGLTSPTSKLIIQCFDFNEVKRLRETFHYKGKLVQLLGENAWGESDTDYSALMTVKGMKKVAKYANGIGPWIPQLLDSHTASSDSVKTPDWLRTAQSLKLMVHPYTFRTDALPSGLSEEALLTILTEQLKVDGVFTDHVPPVTSFIYAQ